MVHTWRPDTGTKSDAAHPSWSSSSAAGRKVLVIQEDAVHIGSFDQTRIGAALLRGSVGVIMRPLCLTGGPDAHTPGTKARSNLTLPELSQALAP